MNRSFFRFVTIHTFERRTDGKTDGLLIARSRCMQLQRGDDCGT